jgi:serine/threonine-protein kinase
MLISGARRDLAISPDGRTLVYSAMANNNPMMMTRRLDQLDEAPLRGPDNAVAPFFSADSQWIGFLDNGDPTSVKKVPVAGGPPIPICKAAATVYGAAWLADGTIVLGVQSGPLVRVSEAGGTPEPLTELDKTVNETDHLWPSAIPGTSALLFVVNQAGRTPMTGGQLAVLDLKTKTIKRLGITGSSPRYSASGHIVYAVEDGSVRAIRFDPGTMTTSGNPMPVLDAVSIKVSGAANFDVSGDGRLVFTGGTSATLRTIVFTDRKGGETAVKAEPRAYYYARVSPDSKLLSLDVRDQEQDIWIWEIGRENLQRLTSKAGNDQYGLWAPNSQHVIFSSNTTRTELFWHRPDGVGQPEQLSDTAAEKLVPFPNAVTPDGKQIIFRASLAAGKNDLFVLDIGGDKKPKKLLDTEHDERNAALSKDGRFMAFESDLSGKFEIYVRPYPDVNRRQWPVSTGGGSEPVWAQSGQEIFYVSPNNKLMSVPVKALGTDLEFGKPSELFDVTPYFFGGVGRNYDVFPDGKRFVMVKNPVSASGGGPRINVVINWVDELRTRLK